MNHLCATHWRTSRFAWVMALLGDVTLGRQSAMRSEAVAETRPYSVTEDHHAGPSKKSAPRQSQREICKAMQVPSKCAPPKPPDTTVKSRSTPGVRAHNQYTTAATLRLKSCHTYTQKISEAT